MTRLIPPKQVTQPSKESWMASGSTIKGKKKCTGASKLEDVSGGATSGNTINCRLQITQEPCISFKFNICDILVNQTLYFYSHNSHSYMINHRSMLCGKYYFNTYKGTFISCFSSFYSLPLATAVPGLSVPQVLTFSSRFHVDCKSTLGCANSVLETTTQLPAEDIRGGEGCTLARNVSFFMISIYSVQGNKHVLCLRGQALL